MSRTLRPRQQTNTLRLKTIEFMERVLGQSLIINPAYLETFDGDIELGLRTSSDQWAAHDKKMICEFATSPKKVALNQWIVTAKFAGNPTMYDISADIVMKNNWYQSGIIKLATTNIECQLYLKYIIQSLYAQKSKYKKKAKKIRTIFGKHLVDARLLLKQYGIFLGYNVWSTLNKTGTRKQQSKIVKMPILIYNTTQIFQSFLSTLKSSYTRGQCVIYNVNKTERFFEWLGIDYVSRQNEYGLWSMVQNQIIYNKLSQTLMIKYDVNLHDNMGRDHHIYRDINKDNPYYAEIQEIIVFGAINKWTSYSIPTYLTRLCLSYTYDNDV